MDSFRKNTDRKIKPVFEGFIYKSDIKNFSTLGKCEAGLHGKIVLYNRWSSLYTNGEKEFLLNVLG